VKNVGIGDDARTFVTNDPLNDDTNVAEAPYSVLYRRIVAAVKEHGAKNSSVRCGSRRINPAVWAALLPNDATSFKDHAFQRPSSMRTGFVQWLPLYDRKRIRITEGRIAGAGEGDPAFLMMLSGSAMQTLKDAACEATSENPTGSDWDESYVHGDFTRLDGSGKFCVIYNAQYHVNAPSVLNRELPGAIRDEDEQEFDPAQASSAARKTDFAQYSIAFAPKVKLPNLEGTGTALYSERKLIGAPGVAAQVLANYSEIFDYFHLPSYEEQAKLVALAFRARPEIIHYGWADSPQFMTDEVQAVLNQRTQIATPGNSQDEYDDENSTSVASSIYDDDDDDDNNAAATATVSQDKSRPKNSPADALNRRSSKATGLYDDDDEHDAAHAAYDITEIDVVAADDGDAAFGQEDDSADDLSAAIDDDDDGAEVGDTVAEEEEEDDDEEATLLAALAAAKAMRAARNAKAAKQVAAAAALAKAASAGAARRRRPTDGLPG
jgi:hypothetical protein